MSSKRRSHRLETQEAMELSVREAEINDRLHKRERSQEEADAFDDSDDEVEHKVDKRKLKKLKQAGASSNESTHKGDNSASVGDNSMRIRTNSLPKKKSTEPSLSSLITNMQPVVNERPQPSRPSRNRRTLPPPRTPPPQAIDLTTTSSGHEHRHISHSPARPFKNARPIPRNPLQQDTSTKTAPVQQPVSEDVVSQRIGGRIMDDMSKLCASLVYEGHFSVVPPMSRNHIDLSGSFVREGGSKNWDFFDLVDGEIVHEKPPPPMFPEEFTGGMRDRPLGWWGVIDPRSGEGKYRPAETTMRSEHQEPRIKQEDHFAFVHRRNHNGELQQNGGPHNSQRFGDDRYNKGQQHAARRHREGR